MTSHQTSGDAPVPHVALAHVVSLAAERYPGMEAVVAGTTRFAYREWRARIHRVARGLAGLGIGHGDHVVLLLKNREEHAAIYWACQGLGAIATPLNWRYPAAEIEYCAADAEAVAVVFEPASRDASLAARAALPGVRTWIAVGATAPDGCIDFESLAAGDDDPGAPGVVVAESDVSIMLYTSGTTGRPKGVPRTHRNERSAALAHVVQSRNALGDRTLAVMPLYHTMGVRSMIAMALLNGCLVCLPDWSPAAAASTIVAERVNSLYLVPTLYHDLLALPALAGHDLSRVKKLGYAGAPMSTTLSEQLVARFRPDVFVNHLGSTEVYTHTICDRVTIKPTCAGRAGVFGRVRVVRPDPERQGSPDDLVKRGDTGELIVSLESPEAFAGYWRRPDADARALRGGWYFTGDLVYEDDEGDIYTVGRVDDMIISGGENIYPIEVEDVLLKHPDVAEACVVGLPDERLGQAVTAFVVCRSRVPSPETLDAFCRDAEGFASFKRPRRYEFVDALPKSPTGKLLRRVLLDRPAP
jgi:2-furoate---CoA ligase